MRKVRSKPLLGATAIAEYLAACRYSEVLAPEQHRDVAPVTGLQRYTNPAGNIRLLWNGCTWWGTASARSWAVGAYVRPPAYLYSRISDYISVADEMALSEVAAILGVTQRQAQRLAAAGELGQVRRIGRTIVVPSVAVYRAHNNGTTSRGRPSYPVTAWAALALLSGDPASASHQRRLADRLAEMTPIEVARFTRRRATIVNARVTVRIETEALASRLVDAGMKPTGLMSPLAVEWGLAGGDAAQIDGYLYVEPGRALGNLKLREDPGGRIVLRLLELPVDPLPEAAVALDLMESMDSRASTAGAEQLAEMIGRLRTWRRLGRADASRPLAGTSSDVRNRCDVGDSAGS